MFNTEQEVIDWISATPKFGAKPGLHRMQTILAALGDPHKTLKTIHVGGTNGKGSTVSFLSTVLQEAGYQIGTFTSPFIETFNERISLNGSPIPETSLVKAANILQSAMKDLDLSQLGPMTEFELITLLSFLYFQEVSPHLVIYEVGLGGRLDATNVITPLLTGITNIGHDHMEILGGTLELVAYEKLGIVKPGVPLITTEERLELLNVFARVCRERRSPFSQALTHYPPEKIQQDETGTRLDWPGLKGVRLSMKGLHQVKNATLALAMLEKLKEENHLFYTESQLRKGLEKTFWKGRFEVVRQHPALILDGAHNPEGMANLVQTLAQVYPDRKKTFVVSILSGKDHSEMLSTLAAAADRVCFTSFSFPRAQKGSALKQDYPHEASSCEDFKAAIQGLLKEQETEECLIITGSLYFISQVRNWLQEDQVLNKLC